MKPSPQSSSQRIATLIEILPWCVSGVFLGLAIVSVTEPSEAQEDLPNPEALAAQQKSLQLAIAKAELRIEGLQNDWDSDQYDRAYRKWRRDNGFSWLAELQNAEPDADGQNNSPEEAELREISRQIEEVRAAAADSADTFFEEDQFVDQWHREHPEVGMRMRELHEELRENAMAAAQETAQLAAGEPPPSTEVPAGTWSKSEREQLSVLGRILSEAQQHVAKLNPDLNACDEAMEQWRDINRDLLERYREVSESVGKRGELPPIEIPDGPPEIVDAYREAVTELEAQELQEETLRDADGYLPYEILAERERRRVEFFSSIAPLERELLLFNQLQQKNLLKERLDQLQ